MSFTDAPMRFVHPRSTAALFTLWLLITSLAWPQTQTTPPSTPYANSADGLKQLLQDAVNAAKKDDAYALADLVNELSIPDSRDWFRKTYPPEKAESWADDYRSGLSDSKLQLQKMFVLLADSEGEIVAGKLTDAVMAEPGLEWDLLHGMTKPIDVYFADWHTTGSSAGSKDNRIGYFIFIEGKFRWMSLIPPQAGSGLGKAPPKLIYSPKPEYPEKARKANIEGKVIVALVVGVDGVPTEVRVAESLDKELDEKAVAAVRSWKFEPATKDGRPVAVRVNVVVNFRLRD